MTNQKVNPISLLVVIGVIWAVISADGQTLKSWWQAEGNAQDSAGANHGTISLAPVSYVAGQVGQAFSIGGGIVQIPHRAEPTNVTVQAWVKAPSTPGNSRYIVAKGKDINSVAYALYTGASSSGLRFLVQLPTGANVLSPATGNGIWNGNWHLVTGTYDGTTVRLYTNGVQVGTGTAAVTNGIFYNPVVRDAPIVLGDYRVLGGLPFSNGSLDEVKVFDHALSAADVLDTYTNPNSTAATNGLLGWWKGENNAQDSWGTSPGVVVNRTVGFSPGMVGQGFRNNHGYVRVPNSADVAPASSVTVQAWVQSVGSEISRYIVSKSRTGVPSYSLFSRIGYDVNFTVVTGPTNSSPTADSRAVWDGAWHLLAGTYDGSYVRLYLDGLEVGTGVAASGALAYTTAPNSGDLIIGCEQNLANFFPGGIDEVKIYDYALSPSEALAAYTRNTLVSWWQANTNANDSVGANHGATLGTLAYATGRAATGRAFKTAGGAVKVPDATSLQLTNVTLEVTLAGTSPGANKYIVSKSRDASSASYALFTGPLGGLAFYVTLNGVGAVVSPAADASVWDGAFHAIFGTFDGQTARLFVDGKEVGSGTAGAGAIQYGTTESAGSLLFGDFTDSLSSSNFAGTIDQVRLYTTALSATEIANLTPLPVLINAQPQNKSVQVGGTADLAVTTHAPTPLSYQWSMYGTNLPGMTNATIQLANVQTNQAGTYTVAIESKGVTFTTNSALGGQAFRLNEGTVDVANPTGLDLQAVTVQVWARAPFGPGIRRNIVAKSRGTLVSSYALRTDATTGQGASFYVNLLGGITIQSSPSATNGLWNSDWVQLTGTFDGTYVRLYTNGVEVASGTDTFGATIEYAPADLAPNLIVGDFTSPISNNGNSHFPFDVDEIKIYDRALDASEVSTSYTTPGSATTSGLVTWLRGEGNAADAMGTNHGQLMPVAGVVTSGSAVLTVVVPVPALFTNVVATGGNFQADVTGQSGGTYVIQRSSDFVTWTPVHTNTAPFTFTDALSGGTVQFYRALAQ